MRRSLLRALPSRGRSGEEVLDVLRPYLDDVEHRAQATARHAAGNIGSDILLGMMDECPEDLIREVYTRLKNLRIILPSLTDEAPDWWWYEESWRH